MFGKIKVWKAKSIGDSFESYDNLKFFKILYNDTSKSCSANFLPKIIFKINVYVFFKKRNQLKIMNCFLPAHVLAPNPKGVNTKKLIFESLEERIHRSGLKTCGSEKYFFDIKCTNKFKLKFDYKNNNTIFN